MNITFSESTNNLFEACRQAGLVLHKEALLKLFDYRHMPFSTIKNGYKRIVLPSFPFGKYGCFNIGTQGGIRLLANLQHDYDKVVTNNASSILEYSTSDNGSYHLVLKEKGTCARNKAYRQTIDRLIDWNSPLTVDFLFDEDDIRMCLNIAELTPSSIKYIKTKDITTVYYLLTTNILKQVLKIGVALNSRIIK